MQVGKVEFGRPEFEMPVAVANISISLAEGLLQSIKTLIRYSEEHSILPEIPKYKVIETYLEQKDALEKFIQDYHASQEKNRRCS